MAEILRYEHVDISYKNKQVINDISFTLNEGEILGIVGESGSGKSTVIKAIMGLLGNDGLVTKGDIWYQDYNLPDLTYKQRLAINGPEIGMIFQNSGSAFCPIRTVEKQMYECVHEHEKISKEQFHLKALDLLTKIGLEDGERVLKSFPFELSGGMQQRVGIATAMLMGPKILLADEPTSALDVAVQKQVVNEMLRIREIFKTAIIIVTHNIGVVSVMADNVLVMKDGNAIEYGKTQDIINSPKDEYTKRLMSAVPRLKR